MSSAGCALGDYLSAAVTPYVPAELISPEAFARIQDAAGALPGAITDFFGFECALGTDDPVADFLMSCRTSHGSREALAAPAPGCAIPEFLLQRPVWRRILAFASEWARPESPLFGGIHNLWLEFDLNGAAPSDSEPSVFIGSDRLERSSPQECAWLTDLALPLLLGHGLDADVRLQITRCIDLLPPDARLFQVGLMLSRPAAPVRLCVRGIPRTGITAYLSALDWPGSLAELEKLFDSLGEHAERIDLDFDVAGCIQPKIGLECYIGAGRPRLSRFLEYLVASRICTPKKAEAIELWSGMAHGPQHPGAAGDAANGHSVFARAFHHAKIVYEPESPLHAKAYLGVHHRWLTQGQFDRALRGEAVGPGARLKGRTPMPGIGERPPAGPVLM